MSNQQVKDTAGVKFKIPVDVSVVYDARVGTTSACWRGQPKPESWICTKSKLSLFCVSLVPVCDVPVRRFGLFGGIRFRYVNTAGILHAPLSWSQWSAV